MIKKIDCGNFSSTMNLLIEMVNEAANEVLGNKFGENLVNG